MRVGVALMYELLEKPDEAFRYLDRAIEEHDELIVSLPSWKAWDPLRADPRFEQLLHKLNFPQYSLDAHAARLREMQGDG